MAGGGSANPSSPTSVPMRTQGSTTSAFTPRFATLPTAPTTSTGSTPGMYTLSAPTQQNTSYPSFASRMPTSVSGYGNFPQAQASRMVGGPTPDQVRAQMLAYQQQYKPGMQQAQQQVQQFNTNLRAAEEARKAEIARKAAEAEAERVTAELAAKEAARQALLDKLGITADEAKLLLG